MSSILFLRAMFFVVLLPGTVAIYVPLRILQGSARFEVPALSFVSLVAGGLVLSGCTVLLMCVWEFFASGRGTLAPIDPPRSLVVSGLYRYTRNPMYNGVFCTLLGEVCLFRSLALLEYAAGFFVAAHVFVVLYEERTLTSRFGEAYRAYCMAVPRWGVTLAPYTRAAEGIRPPTIGSE